MGILDGLLHRFLSFYQARIRKGRDLSAENGLRVVRHMLGKTKYGFLITSGSLGSSARLVQPILDAENLVVWIGTHPQSRKVAEVHADPRVVFAIDLPKEDGSLVLYGRARFDRDLGLRKRYWKPEWILFFPQGPQGEDYGVLRIEVDRIEVMNFSRKLVAEPFGLRPLVLERKGPTWVLAPALAKQEPTLV